MKCLLRLLLFGLMALPVSSASAQWYVRGDFNSWTNSTNPMTDLGGGHYSYSVAGLSPGQFTEFKVTVNDWSENYPGNNSRVQADAGGNITFHFYDNATPNDGWSPNSKRVGFNDSNQFEWELMGAVQTPVWTSNPAWYLTDLGNGLHTTSAFPISAGTYEFKFRKIGDWDRQVGADFGHNSANAQVTLSDGLYRFELDLPGGRWRAVQVPEPTTALLSGLAVLGMLGVARRRK